MNAGVTPPERQTARRLNDGRKLAWSEWGPANGLSVLFCTGAAILVNALSPWLVEPERITVRVDLW